MSKGILYDATMCIGCKQCEQACAAENGLPYDDKIAAEEVTSAHKFTTVADQRATSSCAGSACTARIRRALRSARWARCRRPLSARSFTTRTSCMGCRYCMVACPFGVPKYEWDEGASQGAKCIMCPDRVAAGKQTACAEICPDRRHQVRRPRRLIQEAQKRIRRQSRNYAPHVFGRDGSRRHLGPAALVRSTSTTSATAPI